MSAPDESKGRMAAARTGLMAVFALAVLIFFAVAISSYRRSPDFGGLLSGIFAGFFIALFFTAAGAWGAMWLARTPKAETYDDEIGGELEDFLGSTLKDLEAIRVEVVRKVRANAAWMTPLGVALGVGLWVLGRFGDDPPDVFDLLLFSVMGGVIGYVWAGMRLGSEYRRKYKDLVLPKLAARFDPALGYRQPQGLDLERLRKHRIFRQFDNAVADDEVVGSYRGLPLSIVELELTYGSGKNKRRVFDGLLTEVTLPRGLRGTTAVIADGGVLGNLAGRFQKDGCERVRLEDPRFEAAYEVYGDDQIGARALLTPAFIERFMALELHGFSRPMALAQDNRLMLVMPKSGGKDLFEPPSYSKPAASRKALVELSEDIAAVLKAADAVIDLDHAARTQASPT